MSGFLTLADVSEGKLLKQLSGAIGWPDTGLKPAVLMGGNLAGAALRTTALVVESHSADLLQPKVLMVVGGGQTGSAALAKRLVGKRVQRVYHSHSK